MNIFVFETEKNQKPIIFSRKAAKFAKGKMTKIVIKNLCAFASLREDFLVPVDPG